MTCADARPLLNAYLDRELDLTAALETERHLATCAACRAEYSGIERVHEEIAAADLDFADDATIRRLERAIRGRGGLPAASQWKTPWVWAALASAAALLLLAVFLPGRFTGSASFDRELVDNHLRSLLATALVEVPSSDQHTVKPWFQGRLEFAPPVPDLAAEGFILAGGRVDVLSGEKAAALVYRRRGHVITLWISRGAAAPARPALQEYDGYRLLSWSKDGMTYHAVSDLNGPELRRFADAIRSR
jgi:anti-sigma factor RsiW